MIFYHGTSDENWAAIQKEGVLWGIHSYRYTYLSPHREIAESYGNVLLAVEYQPVGIDGSGRDNYGFNPPEGMTCWQFSVFIPIPLDKVKRIMTRRMRKEMNLIGAIGKRPCEISLQKIMQELGDRKIVNRTMSLLFDYKEGLRQIVHIPNMHFRKRFTFDWRNKFFERVFDSDLPVGVQTHLWCCMTAYHREHCQAW